MSPAQAELALGQTNLTEVFALLAYAEGSAIALAGSGVSLTVRGVANSVFRDVLDGCRGWQPAVRTFPAHLLAVAHAIILEALRAEAGMRLRETRSASIDLVRMSAAQVGDLGGVAELAHAAGELMKFYRAGDVALLQETVKVCDHLRCRLAAIVAAGKGPTPNGASVSRRAITPPQAHPIPHAIERRGAASAPVAVVDESAPPKVRR